MEKRMVIGHRPLDPTSKPRFVMDPSLTLSEIGSLLYEPVRMLDSKVFKIY